MLDAGQVATEVIYYLVGSRELDGGLICTASHNPKAYTGAKLIREGAIALSGDSGIGDVRDLIAAGLPQAPGGGSVEAVDAGPGFRAAVAALVDEDADRRPQGRPRRRQRHGGPDDRADPRRSRPRAGRDLLEARRRVPRARAQPAAAREPRARDRGRARQRRRPRRSPSTATPTAASSSTRPASSSRATSSRRCSPARCSRKHPGAAILYDVRASRAVADTVTAAGGRAYRNRVGHAFFKRRMREEGSLFGGEVSGHYYFQDFYCADSGTIPALLMLELCSHAGHAALAGCSLRSARATSSPARSTARSPTRRRRSPRSRSAMRTRARTPSTGSRSTTTTGTSTCGPPTPSRCCGCAWSRSSPTRTWSAAATRCWS